MNNERILILDFGSQVTQLIARRVREANVYCEIWPFHTKEEAIQDFAPSGIILSGGPASVTEHATPRIPQSVFALDVPIFAICYGQQALCAQLGGRVEGSNQREFGKAMITVHAASPLLEGIWQAGQQYQVWMSHGDRVTAIPDGFSVLATSDHAPYAMIAHEEKQIYGVQFHPEVLHTPDGAALIKRFCHTICGCHGSWTMASFRQTMLARIRADVGDAHVICALSGGVDSSVAAILIHEAIGAQLHCIFVDTGLLRKNEADQVVSLFRDTYNIPLIHKSEGDRFLSALAEVSDPEQKRKIIGKTFIDVFEAEAKALPNVQFLAQGTLYPDVIESVSFTGGPSVTIKSHHNVGGLPARMNLKLLEPFRDLFKDEVRALGRELGLPEAMVGRHPFPGPGLAIRIPAEVTPEKVALLQDVDAIYLDEIRKAGLYNDIWQAFAVLLPVKTVGVMGDGRTYEYVCALRAVTSTDGMTAEAYPFTHDFLTRTATRIINEVKGVNRVVYDVTSKPPGTIEWE